MKKLKNGVLSYTSEYELFNIGDYIQSLAAQQHFDENIDVFVERESLDKYKGDAIRMILNGWFMHHPENWPPSNKIKPLFVSFHINSVSLDQMLRSESIEYLKRHEPIGCRDNFTVEVLKRYGIDAFFSGCLTLTLGKTYKRGGDLNGVCFVDPFFSYERNLSCITAALFLIAKKYKLVGSVAEKKYGDRSFRSLIKSALFYRCYGKIFSDDVIFNASYINQERENRLFIDDSEKFRCADKMLKIYAKAKYVVTSRIHCALPCLGIGTPVFYVNNLNQSETSSCRLDGLLELFNVLDIDNGKWSGRLIDGNKFYEDYKFENKSKHTHLRDNLIQLCRRFVAN